MVVLGLHEMPYKGTLKPGAFSYFEWREQRGIFFCGFWGAGARLGGGILIGWYFKERCKGGEW